MSRFALAVATDPDWQAACRECAAELASAGEEGGLGFLYVTDHLAPHFAEIARRMRAQTGIEQWVGSVGMGICATGREIFDAPAIVALRGAFDPAEYMVFAGLDESPGALPANVAGWCASHHPHFGVVHADPRNALVPDLIAGLAKATGGAFLVGGLASSRRECPQLAGEVVQGGLSGVLFSSGVAVSTRLSQGCSLIGARHEVTRAERNLIIELDGRPALEALTEAAGDLLMRRPRELGGRVFVALPVVGSDTGDYLVRNLVGLDMEAGVVAVAAELQEGQTLLFCRRDAHSAHQDLRRMVAQARQSMAGPPRGALYFSCLARGPNLFGPDSVELRLIQSELGDVPLAGFFANGEISNDRIYAYTGVLTLFA